MRSGLDFSSAGMTLQIQSVFEARRRVLVGEDLEQAGGKLFPRFDCTKTEKPVFSNSWLCFFKRVAFGGLSSAGLSLVPARSRRRKYFEAWTEWGVCMVEGTGGTEGWTLRVRAFFLSVLLQ